MMTDTWQSDNDGHDPHVTPMSYAQGVHEHLLALADKISAAHVDAYQKIAMGIAELQHGVAKTSDAGQPSSLASAPAGISGAEGLSTLAERATAASATLRDLSIKVGLPYIDAHERAVVALADCQEELAAKSGVDFFKAVACAQAELTREIARARASAAREIAGLERTDA